MTELLWLLVALPLAGALVNILFGKKIGEPVAGWFAFGLVALAWAIALGPAIGFLTGSSTPETIYLFSWIPIVGADVAILWDPLSALLTMIVTGVGALIHLYSIGYMHGDERFGRFFAFLNLFIASMLILVLASNYAVMFIGWELVGLSSYLLISFWFTKPSAAAAGKKAFVVNRIGDWGFLVALMIIFASFGTFDFGIIFASAPSVLTVGTATAITLLLFLGATGKSAQIPLYIWLPDAMEGPTPVSALIHAATMVTAGVFMMARSAVLFDVAPVSGAVVATVGGVTALLAAFIAVTQMDIKKVLAYSTISQLGYMVLGIGVGAYTAGVFHLTTHAFFKALLFLGAGSVIHGMANQQDMRKMGGLRKHMPVTFVTMTVGWLAITGIFPFSGFWSKDEILAAAFVRGGPWLILWFVGVVAALLTAIYMTRLYVLTFFGKPRWADGTTPKESSWTMTAPLVVLALAATIVGLFNTPARLAFEHFLAPSFALIGEFEALSLVVQVELAVFTMIVVIGGIVWTWRKYAGEEIPVEESNFWKRGLAGFGVDDFYGKYLVAPGRVVSQWFADTMDPKGIDGVSHGIGRGVRSAGDGLRTLQTGQVRSYAGGIAIAGVLLIVAIVAFGGGF